MRKLMAACLLLAFVLVGAGCGSASARTAFAPTPTEASEKLPEDTSVSVQESETAKQMGFEKMEVENAVQNTVLVVCFSATGTTRGIAERIAAFAGADLAEIVPAQPYTAEDLNYNERSTRATAEQNTPDARPEIANEISLDGYSTVYLGYPIWWGQAPRIMSTFVESHDFTGMTVIPFCTSGSSDIGQSDDTLAGQAGSGNWLQGRRFPAAVSDNELQAWISETENVNMEKSLHLAINGMEVAVNWESSESVDAVIELVRSEPLTVQMSMYGGFEQVGSLGASLPRNDVQTTTQSGDIVLYSGDQIVVFYGSNSWTYTRLGKIADKSAAELTELLGSSDVTISLSWE